MHDFIQGKPKASHSHAFQQLSSWQFNFSGYHVHTYWFDSPMWRLQLPNIETCKGVKVPIGKGDELLMKTGKSCGR